MTWVFLALGSAVFLGFYEISKKKSLHNNAVWPVLFFVSLTGVVLLSPFWLLHFFAPQFTPQLAKIGVSFTQMTALHHWALAGKALIVSLSWAATYQALRHLPVSVASPVRASAPLFTLFAAIIIFHESPSLLQWLGILVTLGAYWLFALSGRKEPIALHKNPWVGLMLIGTVIGAGSGIYDKYLLQSLHITPFSVQWYFTLYMMGIQGVWALIWWLKHKAHPNAEKNFEWRWSIALVGVLLLIADQFYFNALSQDGALISVVSIIRRSNVAVSFALGIWLLKEPVKKTRIVAVILILIGLALLASH